MSTALAKPVDVTFDPVKHEYRVDGVLKRSVTQVIKSALGTPPGYNELAAERGRKIHEWTAVSDREPVLKGLPREYRGYLRAWNQFLYDTHASIRDIEIVGYFPALDVCGTADRIAIINGKTMVLDIKTGSPRLDADTAQVGAYAAMFGVQHGGLVYIRPSGTYRSTPVDVGQGLARFAQMARGTA